MTFIVENPFDVPEWKTYEAYYEITRIIHELDTGYNQSCLFIYVKPEDEKFDGRFFIFLNKGMIIFAIVCNVFKLNYRKATGKSLGPCQISMMQLLKKLHQRCLIGSSVNFFPGIICEIM